MPAGVACRRPVTRAWGSSSRALGAPAVLSAPSGPGTGPAEAPPAPRHEFSMTDSPLARARQEDLLAHASGMPGAWAGHKPEWDTMVASVGPRLFLICLRHPSGRALANVKLEPEDVVAARAAMTWLEPGFHQNKHHWVSIDLTSADYEEQTARELVEDSYRLVLSLLPRRVREAVLLAHAVDRPVRPTWQW